MRILNTLAAVALGATTGCAEPAICDKETKLSRTSEVIEIENSSEAAEACAENEATAIFCTQEQCANDIALTCPDINNLVYSAAELDDIITQTRCYVFADGICY